jgi:hypothetical protein|tara:strand:- start:174 stop:377 length:204 start_codon:yes stop_codon:yes gene_type:complete
MKIETLATLIIVTMLNMMFTFWMTSDYHNIAQQHHAEQFLIDGMRCVETNLITAGANEYAKVFDCEN